MIRFSLRTFLASVILAGVIVAIYRHPIAKLFNSDSQSNGLIEISNGKQMDEALASPHALIFVHVDWSPLSVVANEKMHHFAKNWRKDGHSPRIDFYFVNLTEAQDNPPAYITDWLSSDSRLPKLSALGAGDIVWLKNGAVQGCVPGYDSKAEDIQIKTQTVFKTKMR